MLGLDDPAGLDVAVQAGVVLGRDPAAVGVALAGVVAVDPGLGNPAEPGVPDHALSQVGHLVGAVPLALELLVAQNAADRFVVGVLVDRGHHQIEGQRRPVAEHGFAG